MVVRTYISGMSLLKVGGRMVYSTCSMNPIENEAVVAEVIFRKSSSLINYNSVNCVAFCHAMKILLTFCFPESH